MATEVVLHFRSELEERLSRKRTQLDATEESIKRYVAFPRDEGFPRTSLKGRLGPPPNRRDNDQAERRPEDRRLEERRSFKSTIESRLGPKPNNDLVEAPAPRRVMSAVVVEHKTRDEAIKESPLDKQDALRGKRIFGRLLGTLQQFCQDENKSQDRMLKKRKIELKIEEKTEKEKEEAITKKRELFSDRKKQQRELRELEAQLLRTEQFELWEKSKIEEMKFIQTQKGTARQISFLPKEHNKLTEKALEETVARIEEEIRVQKELFKADITRIEKRDELGVSGNEDSENLKPSTRISSTVRVVDDVLDNQDSSSEDEENETFGLEPPDIKANLSGSSDHEEEENKTITEKEEPVDHDSESKTITKNPSEKNTLKMDDEERKYSVKKRRQVSTSKESSPEKETRKKNESNSRKKRSHRSSSSD